MSEAFSTPAGSPVVGFSGQTRSFPHDTSYSDQKKTFTIAIIRFSGQVRAFD